MAAIIECVSFRHYASKLIKTSQLKRKKGPSKESVEESTGAASDADLISDVDVSSTTGGAEFEATVQEDGYFEDPNCDSDDCNSRPKKVTKGRVPVSQHLHSNYLCTFLCFILCCCNLQESVSLTTCHLRQAWHHPVVWSPFCELPSSLRGYSAFKKGLRPSVPLTGTWCYYSRLCNYPCVVTFAFVPA